MGTVIGKKEPQVVWQTRRHPEESFCLTLKVRVGASCPGASWSSMCTAYKRGSFELNNVVTNEQSKNSKNC